MRYCYCYIVLKRSLISSGEAMVEAFKTREDAMNFIQKQQGYKKNYRIIEWRLNK